MEEELRMLFKLVDDLATRTAVVWAYDNWEVRVWSAKCDAFVVEELPSLEQPGWCWRTRRYWYDPKVEEIMPW